MELFGTPDDTCNQCGMQSAHGCCSDESQLVKLQDDHLTAHLVFSFKQPGTILPDYILPHVIPAPASNEFDNTPYSTPPDIGVPIYLRNNVFRI